MSQKMYQNFKSELNNNNNNNDNNSIGFGNMELDSDTKCANRQYIELEPAKSGPEHPESSVFFCTAAYSLLQSASIVATLVLLYLLSTKYYALSIIYFAYLFLDRNTCNAGGRRLSFIYNSPFWSHLAAYFPIRLRHSPRFNLSPEKNYILNYHPHGISAFGAVATFATNGLSFSRMFPQIVARFMVHETSFLVPIMREVFLFRGDCSVNSKSFDHMLSKRGSGNLLCLVGGGLAEADLSDQKVLKVVVAQRKGFVKKALMHGADLIPCIAFGENSTFHKVNLERGSLLHVLESKWYKLFKFKHPVYYGRSFFSSKRKGIMPYRRPVTVVMGDPISVERVQEPSQAQIDELHSRYLEQLTLMYKSNSDLCQEFDIKMELV